MVIDLAHNEAGLEALLEIMHGIRPSGGRLLLGVGSAGDRGDEVFVTPRRDRRASARTWSRSRTRPSTCAAGPTAELGQLIMDGAAHAGVTGCRRARDRAGLLWSRWSARPAPATWSPLMTHQDREQVDAWLVDHGATRDDPDTLRAKVLEADRPDGSAREVAGLRRLSDGVTLPMLAMAAATSRRNCGSCG